MANRGKASRPFGFSLFPALTHTQSQLRGATANPPKFERPTQGEIERPSPQGEQHPRPGCGTINDTIVTDQTQLEVQQISAAAGKGKGNDYSTTPFLGIPSLSLPLTWP